MNSDLIMTYPRACHSRARHHVTAWTNRSSSWWPNGSWLVDASGVNNDCVVFWYTARLFLVICQSVSHLSVPLIRGPSSINVSMQLISRYPHINRI